MLESGFGAGKMTSIVTARLTEVPTVSDYSLGQGPRAIYSGPIAIWLPPLARIAMKHISRIAFCGLLLATTTARGDDWPGWMGPERDNIWREQGILESFPKGGPNVLWRTPIADGYAGPSVADGRVFVMDFVRDSDAPGGNGAGPDRPGIERIHCLDQQTGQILWTHKYPVTYTIAYPAGPRCTPLVHEGIVYALGAVGDLHALDPKTGDIIWSKNLRKIYKTTAPMWGYAAHPLILGDMLITLAGGKGSQVVALNKNTGKEIWRALSTPKIGQGYSPPTLIEFEGTRQLIIAQPDKISGLDPRSGDVIWSEPYQADNGAMIMAPVLVDGHLFIGSFNNRNLLVELTSDPPGAKTRWRDKPRHGMSPVNNQPLVNGNVIYGVGQNGWLGAVELPSGDVLWSTPHPIANRPAKFATAMIVRQGNSDRYWFFTEKGDLVIGRLTPKGFKEIDRTHLLEPTAYAFGRDVAWCPPAFAGKCMFVRNGKECICVDLSVGQDRTPRRN